MQTAIAYVDGKGGLHKTREAACRQNILNVLCEYYRHGYNGRIFDIDDIVADWDKIIKRVEKLNSCC